MEVDELLRRQTMVCSVHRLFLDISREIFFINFLYQGEPALDFSDLPSSTSGRQRSVDLL